MRTVNINIDIKGKKCIQSGSSNQKGGLGYDPRAGTQNKSCLSCSYQTVQITSKNSRLSGPCQNRPLKNSCCSITCFLACIGFITCALTMPCFQVHDIPMSMPVARVKPTRQKRLSVVSTQGGRPGGRMHHLCLKTASTSY